MLKYTITDYERGFLEGIIDGEGSLSLKKLKRRTTGVWSVDVLIVNTSYELIEKVRGICERFSVNSGSIMEVTGKKRQEAGDKWKECYMYRIPTHIVRELLPQLTLIAKERQRRLILVALELIGHHLRRDRTEEENKELEAVYDDLKELNRRGKHVIL